MSLEKHGCAGGGAEAVRDAGREFICQLTVGVDVENETVLDGASEVEMPGCVENWSNYRARSDSFTLDMEDRPTVPAFFAEFGSVRARVMPSVTTATLVGGLPFASVHAPVTHNGILLNCCAVDVDSQWRRRVFMLVLSRQSDETIIIGDNIRVTIVEVRGDKVRIGIDAPRDVTVHRQEIYDAIRRDSQDGVKVV